MHTNAPLNPPQTRSSTNGGAPRGGRLRIVAWIAAAMIFLLPMIAMQFSDEVAWTLGDFIVAGILLFGSLGIYELTARTSSDLHYRAGVGLAIGAVALLVWTNGAVGITDSRADVMYLGVIAVGVVGAIVARFRARGMAAAMSVVAVAQALVGVGALVAGIVPGFNSAFEILGVTGFFVALFAASAWMFWNAASRGQRQSKS